MAKSTKKRTAAASAASLSKRSKSRKLAKKGRQVAVRSGTNQATTIEMLRYPSGATIDALRQATGWQQHSVHGFANWQAPFITGNLVQMVDRSQLALH